MRADVAKRHDTFSRTTQNPNLLKFWVSECVTQHGQCASGTEFLPTRLLDLGGPGEDEDENTVRIVVTARQEVQDRRYMALSHRWDQFTKSAQSTMHNIEHHEQAISLTTLPPSFQYAACVARQLGLRYLWIDSLCILQDSREDWSKESAQMGQVYGQSFCTIATSNDDLEAYNRLHSDQESGAIPDSEDVSRDIGFLPNWIQLIFGGALENGKEDNEQGMRLVRIFDKKPSDWESTLEKTVLSGRGWTLQERQLSPRIIHVTSTTLLWECYTCRGSDQVPWTDEVQANVKTKARYRFNDKMKNPRRMPRDHPDHHYGSWYNLVWDYSNRILTHDTDKMPGLAGLAKTMAPMVNDEYVAGLWRRDLISGLLWKARRWASSEECESLGAPSYQVVPMPPGSKPSGPHGPMEHSRPAYRRAPTWSWMSLDGQVIHRTDHHEQERDKEIVLAPEAVVVDMSFPGSDPDADPYAQAEGGLLTITGYVRPAVARHLLRDLKLKGMAPEFWTGGYKTLHKCPSSEATSVSGDGVACAEIDITTAAESSKVPSYHLETEQEDCVGCVQYDVVDDMVPDQTIHVLALRRLERKEPWRDATPECIFTVRDERRFPIHDQVLGLALVPTGRSPNEYRRVGLAEFVDASWFTGCERETVTIV